MATKKTGAAKESGSARKSPAFPAHPVVVVRWTYVYDNIPDELGGGFHSGEFVLLADGRLFRRSACGLTSKDSTSWEASAWEADPPWVASTNVASLFDHLSARGYELYPPTPIPVDETIAGPFPGAPDAAGEPLRKEDVAGFDRDLFKRALDFAARAHGEQKVPGSGLPYAVHVAKVAMEVLAATEGEVGLDRNVALACALLHDTVEDAADQAAATETLVKIRAVFGEAVAAGVLALTKNAELPKSDRMEDSLRRIREQPREVWLVKLADRITNLEPPPPAWSVEKRREYLKEASAILKALGDASQVLRRRFEQKLVEYERYCK